MMIMSALRLLDLRNDRVAVVQRKQDALDAIGNAFDGVTWLSLSPLTLPA